MAPRSGMLKKGDFMMKKWMLGGLCLLCACAGNVRDGAVHYRVSTERDAPYYLSTEAEKVEDTCPGHDIIHPYTCTKTDADGSRCFDVSMVQGSPTPSERYTLLQQTVEVQDVSAEPLCPALKTPDCASFLSALNHNLEFSWYLVNFPSSSFPQCRETYDCKRIDCYLPADPSAGQTGATLVSCVYKRNQVFFVGAEVTCRRSVR